jgi:fucose 4-O-acetylase-like acetyltransferase
MPLFMFVSGFVSYKNEYKAGSITKRFMQLVVPFLAWGIISDLLARQTLTIDWIIQPDKGLWFLWVLFWISTIVYSLKIAANHFKIKEELLFIPIALVMFVIPIINKLAFGFHLVAWYLPFFLMGYLLRKHYAIFAKPFNYLSLPLFAIFLLSVQFWMMQLPPTFLPADAGAVYNFAYKFFVATIACISLFGIASKALNNPHKVLIYTQLLGGVTLGIYAIHQPIIKLVRQVILTLNLSVAQSWLIIALFAATLLITLSLYFLLSLNKYTAFLFLGKGLMK